MSLCTPRRHVAGVEVEIHLFLNKTLMDVTDQLHVAAPLFVEQEAGPRNGPDVLWDRKFSLASIGIETRIINPGANQPLTKHRHPVCSNCLLVVPSSVLSSHQLNPTTCLETSAHSVFSQPQLVCLPWHVWMSAFLKRSCLFSAPSPLPSVCSSSQQTQRPACKESPAGERVCC